MSLLDGPEAKALLAEAAVLPEDVEECAGRLTAFLSRYLPQFYRVEQGELAKVVIQGKLSKLERKTCEPIAYQAGRQRKPVQHFVGAGKWQDQAVLGEMRRHLNEVWGDDDGVLALDGSSFPKSGSDSCGVARQWCGRLGKKENCQTGVFAAYASARGRAPLDCQLYLPVEWAKDQERRAATYVPRDVRFQEKWRIALDLVDRCAKEVKHGWVTGDDEFGRVTEFRAQLRVRRERYVVDVPCNTLVREIGDGTKKGKFERVDAWAARQPTKDWKTITVREGSKGWLRYRAIKRRVQTKDSDGRVGPTETVLVMQSLGKEPQTWYALSNAEREVKLAALVEAKQKRHDIEEVFHDGKGQVGLGHYEVRSWVGWHHHMTLSMLALWFLLLEKEQLGEKNTSHHRAASSRDHGEPTARPAAKRGRNRRAGDAGAAA